MVWNGKRIRKYFEQHWNSDVTLDPLETLNYLVMLNWSRCWIVSTRSFRHWEKGCWKWLLLDWPWLLHSYTWIDGVPDSTRVYYYFQLYALVQKIAMTDILIGNGHHCGGQPVEKHRRPSSQLPLSEDKVDKSMLATCTKQNKWINWQLGENRLSKAEKTDWIISR